MFPDCSGMKLNTVITELRHYSLECQSHAEHWADCKIFSAILQLKKHQCRPFVSNIVSYGKYYVLLLFGIFEIRGRGPCYGKYIIEHGLQLW